MKTFIISYIVPSIIGVIIFGGWVVRDAKKIWCRISYTDKWQNRFANRINNQ